MSTRARIWGVYTLVAILLVAALSWASVSVASLELKNEINLANTQRQETIRAALWRLDSRVSTLIALEAARPAPAHRALIENQGIGDAAQPIANGYFEYGRAADPSASDAQTLSIARRTRSLRSGAPQVALLSELSSERESPSDDEDPSGATVPEDWNESSESKAADFESRKLLTQPIQSAARASAARADQAPEKSFNRYSDQGSGYAGSRVSVVEPIWVASSIGAYELVLVRTIVDDQGAVTQGVWLDWVALERELLTLTNDLLPTSTLRPILPSNSTREGYELATVPVEFIPGGAIALPPSRITAAIMALIIMWVAVLSALIASGFVLRAVLGLSERRAKFVSAVTHELRTPLTTFRLYAQMLADGMIPDETVRQDYLRTLNRESDRLTGIVENVLEYARLTRRRQSAPIGERTLSIGELMAQVVPPMSRRAEESGMDLVVSDETQSESDSSLTLDPRAVERVLMNLIDNACKYAAPEGSEEADTRIHLDAAIIRTQLSLRVADHGPGVAPRDRRKVFGEFVRGSVPHTKDRSGLGLGLALSRGLAREMGGDLNLVHHRGHGAEFELTIPLNQS